jgi:predicted CopG family antitoxin
MSVKTVTLTKEAYDALAAMKNEGESFSEVVTRLTGSKILLSAFAGAWSGVPKKTLDDIDRFLRESDRLSETKLRRLARVGKHGG